MIENNKLQIMENRQRLDLTEWIIHFVHDRKPMDNPIGLYEDYILCSEEFEQETLDNIRILTEEDSRLPDYYDEHGKSHFIHDTYMENEYEIEEGLSSIRVPRLILQPLVENSIYHGIRPKGEHGVIRVTVKRQEDFLFLSVYDNGIGMSAHQRELLFSGKDSRSFGFQGTIERIRYYYKTEDVFEIHSTEGEYCEIILKLPLSNGC